MHLRIVVLAILVVTMVAFAQPNATLDTPYQVRYAANLQFGESYINMTNSGANGAPPFGPGYGPQAGNICVNVYAFDKEEELISCCSCWLSPNKVANLGVIRDLTSNTLTGTKPNEVTVKLISTLAGDAAGSGDKDSCKNSAAKLVAGAQVPGLVAFGTTLHATPVAGTFATTETPFIPATLSAAEVTSIVNRCTYILGNASGFGICGTCQQGALGAPKQ